MDNTTPDAPRTSRATTGLAMTLWVIVTVGLVYGVGQTVVKAAALFTG